MNFYGTHLHPHHFASGPTRAAPAQTLRSADQLPTAGDHSLFHVGCSWGFTWIKWWTWGCRCIIYIYNIYIYNHYWWTNINNTMWSKGIFQDPTLLGKVQFPNKNILARHPKHCWGEDVLTSQSDNHVYKIFIQGSLTDSNRIAQDRHTRTL